MSEWFWSTQTTFFISSLFFTPSSFVFLLVNSDNLLLYHPSSLQPFPLSLIWSTFSDNLLLYDLSSTYYHILFVFVLENFLLNHPYSLPSFSMSLFLSTWSTFFCLLQKVGQRRLCQTKCLSEASKIFTGSEGELCQN